MTFPVVQGQRVALREYRVEDKDTIQPWLGEVVSAAGIADPVPRPANEQAPQTIREGLPLGGSRSGTLVIQLVSEGEPLGFLEYEFARGWLAVPFIALAKPYRGWGYGSEAVRLLEGWAQSERVPKRFRADVPVGNGLALYFWLRLGYRPKSASAGDGHAVMMMVREIETGKG